MPTVHAASIANVRASIIRYFTDELAQLTTPALLGTYTIVVNRPETTLPTPSISFDNIPAGLRDLWQGNNVGAGERGVKALAQLDASCWATRKDNSNWSVQLDILQALLQQVYIKANAGIPVRDYLTDAYNAVTLPYLIRLIELETVQTAHDENPAIERRRNLIAYWWTERAS